MPAVQFCRHCGHCLTWERRGLCRHCYQDPTVRTRYTRHAGVQRPPPVAVATFHDTFSLPGSEERIEELTRRASAGQPLCHRGDRCWDDREHLGHDENGHVLTEGAAVAAEEKSRDWPLWEVTLRNGRTLLVRAQNGQAARREAARQLGLAGLPGRMCKTKCLGK